MNDNELEFQIFRKLNGSTAANHYVDFCKKVFNYGKPRPKDLPDILLAWSELLKETPPK
jgi:hypothetical protein